MTLLGKVLPTQLAGTPEQPIVLSVEQHRERAAQIIREAFEPLRVDEGEPWRRSCSSSGHRLDLRLEVSDAAVFHKARHGTRLWLWAPDQDQERLTCRGGGAAVTTVLPAASEDNH
jgi:hypothetical protein